MKYSKELQMLLHEKKIEKKLEDEAFSIPSEEDWNMSLLQTMEKYKIKDLHIEVIVNEHIPKGSFFIYDNKEFDRRLGMRLDELEEKSIQQIKIEVLEEMVRRNG